MNDDTISRQAAICAIEEYADRLQMVNWKENPGVPYKAHALNWAINTLRDLPSAERRGRWTIEAVHQYELAYGATAYEPVYKCSCCGLVTESYLRFDEPIMPDDADFPKWCGNCGARMDGEEE